MVYVVTFLFFSSAALWLAATLRCSDALEASGSSVCCCQFNGNRIDESGMLWVVQVQSQALGAGALAKQSYAR